MTTAIAGLGWVTPLGREIEKVWARICAGESAAAEEIASALSAQKYPIIRVPASATSNLPVHPRLRRSSAISRFAVAAGVDALRDAGVEMNSETANRTALVLAISNGGVVYTKRFYAEVVQAGAQAASPLLFPETVFNAPASHLAAILGITGASYTLVGDGAVGALALKMADDLLQNETLDRCLVVGAEEADWLLCDAYYKWRLLRRDGAIEPFAQPARGTLLSEGAGAVLLTRAGDVEIAQVDPGSNFSHQREAGARVSELFGRLKAGEAALVIASANGTFIDAAERAAISQYCPNAFVFAPKAALGESVGASVLWQTVCAAHLLRAEQFPHSPSSLSGASYSGNTPPKIQRALVSACGMNQQIAGFMLARA